MDDGRRDCVPASPPYTFILPSPQPQPSTQRGLCGKGESIPYNAYSRRIYSFNYFLLIATGECYGYTRILQINPPFMCHPTIYFCHFFFKTTVNSFNASIKYFETNTYFLSILVKKSFFLLKIRESTPFDRSTYHKDKTPL